jgi:hypothetical protein
MLTTICGLHCSRYKEKKLAKPIMKYVDDLGNLFSSPEAADHSNWQHGITEEIRSFVRERFPIGTGQKVKNPHQATAMKAVSGFVKRLEHLNACNLPYDIGEEAKAYVHRQFPRGTGPNANKNPHHNTALRAIAGFLERQNNGTSYNLIA